MRRLFAEFLTDENGTTAIEYCLIACGVSLAIFVIVQSFGVTLAGRYTAVSTELTK